MGTISKQQDSRDSLAMFPTRKEALAYSKYIRELGGAASDPELDVDLDQWLVAFNTDTAFDYIDSLTSAAEVPTPDETLAARRSSIS